MSAKDIIERLEMIPHPEGGWYRETWRAEAKPAERAAGTAIYYLLERGQRSHWHRIDATEIWHFYAGDPLTLSLSEDGEIVREHVLGAAIESDQKPQLIVPPNCWQAAESQGAWTLVGCTVSPAFDFAAFELAPPNWRPTNG